MPGNPAGPHSSWLMMPQDDSWLDSSTKDVRKCEHMMELWTDHTEQMQQGVWVSVTFSDSELGQSRTQLDSALVRLFPALPFIVCIVNDYENADPWAPTCKRLCGCFVSLCAHFEVFCGRFDLFVVINLFVVIFFLVPSVHHLALQINRYTCHPLSPNSGNFQLSFNRWILSHQL